MTTTISCLVADAVSKSSSCLALALAMPMLYLLWTRMDAVATTTKIFHKGDMRNKCNGGSRGGIRLRMCLFGGLCSRMPFNRGILQ